LGEMGGWGCSARAGEDDRTQMLPAARTAPPDSAGHRGRGQSAVHMCAYVYAGGLTCKVLPGLDSSVHKYTVLSAVRGGSVINVGREVLEECECNGAYGQHDWSKKSASQPAP